MMLLKKTYKYELWTMKIDIAAWRKGFLSISIATPQQYWQNMIEAAKPLRVRNPANQCDDNYD